VQPPSRLEEEAREQGRILAARTAPGWEHAARAAEALSRADVDHLVIAARGSSDNAARYAQYLFGSDSGLLVGLAAPWLYESDSTPGLTHAAVLAISQSGSSPDIAAVLNAARDQGRPSIVITNQPSSPMGRLADIVVPLLAGDERSVAATKTYLTSLHALAQIAACLRGDRTAGGWFERTPELVDLAINEQLDTRARFDRLGETGLLTVVARGLQLPTAHETALKVRELSGIPAEAFSLPDLIHGPIAALGPTGSLWVISTAGREQPDADVFETLRRSVGITVAVSDHDDLVAAADIGIRIPSGLPEWVAPMLAVLPAQAAALRLGEIRGVDVDHPHGLRKVTLTR
jgi:glucosamine--fructose-6-phosphate aminotransferase (isomerizing)